MDAQVYVRVMCVHVCGCLHMDENMSDWTRVHKCCESKNVCAYMPLCEYMSGSWVCPDVYLYVYVLEIMNKSMESK